MKKCSLRICVIIVMILFLFGCQASPRESLITSKNDGRFEQILQETIPTSITQQYQLDYRNNFTSSDGSVEISFCIDQGLSAGTVPVFEVVPHFFSGDDALRIAQVLFENSTFYEQGSVNSPSHSKGILQEHISILAAYANQEALEDLYGTDSDMSDVIDSIKRYINYCSEQLNTATVDENRCLCDWTLKKDSNGNLSINATTKYNDIEYEISVTARNSVDYKLNEIYINLGDSTGPSVLKRILQSQLLRTSKPTDMQILEAKEKSQDMLSQMPLGEWVVYDAAVETKYYGGIPEYTIQVKAVPRLDGFDMVAGQERYSSTGSGDYSSNYGTPAVQFQFSANGTLVAFRMDSPIDIKTIINPNVATLSMEELIGKAASFLSLSDSKANFGIPVGYPEVMEDMYGEEIICKIGITQIEYGFARVDKPNSDDTYYYIPALVCKGIADYCGRDSGTVYQSTSDYDTNLHPLVWINAIDGSVI